MTARPDDVETRTRQWLERLVIGLNLCPFAAAPYQHGRVALRICDENTEEAVYQAFLLAADELINSDPAELETTLLVVPQGLTDFTDYLDTLAVIEEAVSEAGLDGILQVASFHPDYCFDGAPADDPANYTNRSPYPMFHLIREAGLSAALESYPDPERIPQRNVERLHELGIEGIRRILDPD